MTQDDDPVKDKNRQLVQKIYSGALNPAEFNQIFHAWDDYYRALGGLDNRLQSEDFGWMDEIVDHFETAGEFFDRLHKDREVPLAEQILRLPQAAMLCDGLGRIVASNDRASNAFMIRDRARVQDMLATPAMGARLLSLTRAEAREGKQRMIVSLVPATTEEPEIFLAEGVIGVDRKTGRQAEQILLRSLNASWGAEVATALKSAYGLTPAELGLVEQLYKGLSVRELAEQTGRSQGTVRAQLHSVLSKTATRGQPELLRIVAGLVQALQTQDSVPPEAPPRVGTALKQQRRTLTLADGVMVEVVTAATHRGGRSM